jgi:hypothetical protein
MKRHLLALLLLLGAAAMAVGPAFAQTADFFPERQFTSRSDRDAARPKHLRTSAAQAGDTLWVGHSRSNHFNPASNYWNIYSGNNLGGIADGTTARWDFDDYTGIPVAVPGRIDSLQGWWPTRQRYTGALASMTDDKVRTWGCLDQGNEIDQVVPGQSRVKGLLGVWHADPGNDVSVSGNNPPSPYIGWKPISGHQSAWCGLRALHDRAVIDPITKNAFSEEALELYDRQNFNSLTGTLRNLPGYGKQWDQMLYRDFTPADNTPLSVAFLYRVRVSSGADPGTATRAGWFHGDPLSVSAGNFISAADAGVNAPVDSFQVFAGVPVDDANCTYSNGFSNPVYDPQRRWFSEVLRLFDSPAPPVYELYSTSGAVPNDTTNVPALYAGTLSASQVHSIVGYPGNAGGRLRLVFRVKTNRYQDDTDFGGNKMPIGSGVQVGNGYTSFGRGAALVDSITVNGVVQGDFEPGSAHPIDNSSSASATTFWKSTGKPPASWFHAADVQTLTWHDICGRPNTSTSQCDMAGVVLDAGNADDGDGLSESRYPSMKEAEWGIVSPSVDLTPANTMGIDAAHVVPTDDIYVNFDVYPGALSGSLGSGAYIHMSAYAYPVRQLNGVDVWSDRIRSPFIVSFGAANCAGGAISGLYGENLLHTTNASGVPDSIRIYVGILSQCFVFGATVTCNSRDGAYFDNLALAFTNKTTATVNAAGTIQSNVWDWFADAFPVNGPFGTSSTPGTAAFDTTTALVTGSINNAPLTGDKLRYDVLMDTILVQANNGSNQTPGDTNSVDVRTDLVFRILPGPGNYQVAAGRTFPPTSAMKLLTVPSNQASVVATPPAAGDHSFWAEYIRSPGQFSKGTHNNGQYWDYLTWNSARCDSAEANIFPVVGKSTTGLTAGLYASMYHESDPKFTVLGIDKYRCFIVDTTKAAQVDPTFDNIECDGGHPAYLDVVPRSRTGWDGTVITREFTKIIPDGLLTPGTHMQYFWRKQQVFGNGAIQTDPDTTQIRPQIPIGGAGLDAERWSSFAVLPDNWKKAPWGAGLACMLYADYADNRGDETVFISVMDSIGGTSSNKWGAHNGWHAVGGTDLDNATNPNLSSAFVHGKNQQPGTVFDMYQFRGSESGSSSGTRLGNRLLAADQSRAGKLTGKSATSGPTPDMLAQYRILALLTGNLNSILLGPATNVAEADTTLFEQFIATATNRPRALFFQGQGFVSREHVNHGQFLANRLGVLWRDDSYLILSGNSSSCSDLATVAPITLSNDVFAVENSCVNTLDVLSVNAQLAEAVAASTYENVGVNGPYVASVLKPSVTGGREWVALTDGWDIRRQWSRYCESDVGRLQYYYRTMSNLFAGMCSTWGSPAVPLDVPQTGGGSAYANFLKVGNSVVRSGNATIRFGVASTDRVRVRLYDVTGRLVRTLADRTFQANEYSLPWDGADDAGREVSRGVYFARIDYATKGASISGRVVVLR